MKINPEYALVNGQKYKINTDYRIALECNRIACDKNISDYEKPLAIIYILFGEVALKDPNLYEKFLKQAIKFLRLGDENNNIQTDVIDFDFEQDYRYIKDSIIAERNINIEKENMHFWDFYDTLNGLTENCILNRIREIRTYDTKDLAPKDREKINNLKKQFALKKKVTLSDDQLKSVKAFYDSLNRKE